MFDILFQLAAKGCDIVLVSRSLDKLKAVAEEIGNNEANKLIKQPFIYLYVYITFYMQSNIALNYSTDFITPTNDDGSLDYGINMLVI